jgi:hypothetical protein
MPSMVLLKPFRYNRTKHKIGSVIEVEDRHVKLLTGLRIAKASTPTPTPLPAPPRVYRPNPEPFEGRTDPPKRPLRKRDTSEDA